MPCQQKVAELFLLPALLNFNICSSSAGMLSAVPRLPGQRKFARVAGSVAVPAMSGRKQKMQNLRRDLA